MEYIYAALLLNEAGKEVNKENVKKVLEAVGIAPDEAKLNVLVSALEGVDIKEVISKNAGAMVAAAPSSSSEEKKEEKKEEKEEEKELSEEEAAAGLSALFG